MFRGITRRMLNLALLAEVACISAFSQTAGQKLDLNEIVAAMERAESQTHPQNAYQVIREYDLSGGNNASANSTVVAELEFQPPSTKNYTIQQSSGSSRGQQVVRKLLDHEVQSENQPRAAVTRDNYDFTYLGEATLDGQPCYLLGLRPKRKEKELISGQAWVDKRSLFIRRIEGETAKTPSWWLKHVWVNLAFADFEGAWLQTSMKAVAEVRMFGSHTLPSRILDYRGAHVLASGVAASGWRSSRRH